MSSHLSGQNFFADRYELEPKFGKENYDLLIFLLRSKLMAIQRIERRNEPGRTKARKVTRLRENGRRIAENERSELKPVTSDGKWGAKSSHPPVSVVFEDSGFSVAGTCCTGRQYFTSLSSSSSVPFPFFFFFYFFSSFYFILPINDPYIKIVQRCFQSCFSYAQHFTSIRARVRVSTYILFTRIYRSYT